MKKSLKTFKTTGMYNGYTILIYGELWEEGYIDGMILQRAKFSKDGRKIMDLSMDHEGILLTRPYTRTRYFNMGYAICSPEDKYNEAAGIEICKRRFRKSPLKTETGLFLTKDMIHAIMCNEIDYIINHWDKFVHSKKNNNKKILEAAQRYSELIHGKKNVDNLEDECTGKNEKCACKCETKNECVGNFERPGIGPDSYVRVLNTNENDDSVSIGYVKDLDDKGVNCLWIIKFGKNFSSFRVNSDKMYLLNEDIRPATKEEVSNALKAIENNTSFHWNVSEKRLEIKYI